MPLRLLPAWISGRSIGPVTVHQDACECSVCRSLAAPSELPIRRRGEVPEWALLLGLPYPDDATGLPVETFSSPLDYRPGSIWQIEGQVRVVYAVVRGDAGLEAVHREPNPIELGLLRDVPVPQLPV